jgi:hypothetical protein
MNLSNAFRHAFLSKPSTSPDITVFAHSSQLHQAIMAEHPTVAALAIVEPSGLLRIRTCPIVVRNDDGTISAVVSNGSNTNLVPGISGPNTFQHFVSIGQRRSIPSFAIKGSALPEELFTDSGLTYVANTFLFLLPRAILLGYGKDWVEGDINDPAVIDLFEHEYGPDYGAWLRAIKAASTPAVAKAANIIHKKLSDTNQLVQYLSGLSTEVTSTTGPAFVYTSSINEVTHPAELALLQERLQPLFTTVQATPPLADPTPTATGFTAAELAAALTSRDERKESNKLRDGFVKLQSIFVGGTISLDTPSLTSIVLPEPTTAHKEANLKTTIDECTDALKRILDMANTQRVDRALLFALESHRSMALHDYLLCRQILLGNWSMVPVNTISDKQILVGVLHFIPPTTEETSSIQREHDESELSATLNNSTQDKRTRLLSPTRLYGVDQVKRLLANFISASNSLWVSDGDEDTRPIIARVFLEIFNYLYDQDFTEYYAILSREDRENFTYHLVSRMDRLVCRFVRAGNDFGTNSAIVAGNAQAILLTQYRRAFIAWANDWSDIKTKVDRGYKLEHCTSLRPAQLPRANAAAGTATAAAASTASTTGGTGGKPSSSATIPKRHRDDSSTTGSGGATKANTVQRTAGQAATANWSPSVVFPFPRAAKYDVVHGKKMGDFIMKDGFSTLFPESITDKFCHGFSTLGQACGRSECTKVHLPFGKWTPANQATQIAHVEANFPNIAFNKAFVRNLPEDKTSLLLDPTGMS